MKLVKLNCPSCNAKLEVNEDMKQFTCTYCGTTTMIDDEIERIEVTHNNRYIDEAKIKALEVENEKHRRKMEDKDKDRKNDMRILVGCAIFFAAMLVFGLISSYFDNHAGIGGVMMPADYKSYKGENYEIVEDKLEDLGFEDIETKELKDLSLGILNKENTVDSVSIAGNDKFEKGDKFKKKDHVVIYYHTFKDKE